MLINSVIIILSEVLEAAILIALLLVLTRQLNMHWHWLIAGTSGGAALSWIYGVFLGDVSDLFGGVGQEVVNVLLQMGIYLCLSLIIYVAASLRVNQVMRNTVYGAMVLATMFVITHEGAEIYLFLSGFWGASGAAVSVYSGAAIGLGIGCSLGVLFFVLFTWVPDRAAKAITLAVLALVAAGVCLQTVQLLVQANWITSSTPVWDTSILVGEHSVGGQLLHVIFGYEASPSGIELGVYLLSLTFSAALVLLPRTIEARRPCWAQPLAK